MDTERPLFTIITVVYNCADSIEQTIQSVLSQTCPSMEYIIVDGGSTDGTLEIIERYKTSVTKFISKPDKGIYDAMNRGISMAEGQWVNFMNSGDTFTDPSVLAQSRMASSSACHASWFSFSSSFRSPPTVLMAAVLSVGRGA